MKHTLPLLTALLLALPAADQPTLPADPFLGLPPHAPRLDGKPGDPNDAFSLKGTYHLHCIMAHDWTVEGKTTKSCGNASWMPLRYATGWSDPKPKPLPRVPRQPDTVREAVAISLGLVAFDDVKLHAVRQDAKG